MAASSSPPPECIAVLADGRRVTVDLFSSSTSSTSSTPPSSSCAVEAVELRRVHLDRQLSPAALERLVATARPPTLRALLLEDCVLADRVVAALVAAFGLQSRLGSLVLRRCRQLSMTSLMSVTSLVQLSPLETLELSSCHLARQAGILLGQALQTRRGLRRLVLSGNNLRDGGLKAIADGIRAATLTSDGGDDANRVLLDVVDVTHNGISSVGLAALAALPITRLVLRANGVASVGAALFTGNRQLESVDFSGNPLTDDAVRELVTQALQAPLLRELQLQHCGLSDASEAFLTKALLLKAKTSRGCALRALHVGEKPPVDEMFDDDDVTDADDAPPSAATERFQELKRCLESRVPGLVVQLPEEDDEQQRQWSQRGAEDDDDAEDDDGEGEGEGGAPAAEPETPGRQVRRELLERTEFLRRHSEELPLSDDDESLVSFVSDKLESRTPRSKPPRHPRGSFSTAPSLTATATSGASVSASAYLHHHHADDAGDRDPLSASRRVSSSSSSFAAPPLRHSTSSASFFLSSNPSLDDVASQFSIDPPPSAMTSALQHADVEFIVGRTIDTLNRNFEQRLSQFLMRMEFQQQEKNATQLQSLAAKVEACERAIPRLEARLDVLADRIATSGAQVVKMQSEWQTKQQQLVASSSGSRIGGGGVGLPLAATTLLTLAMQTQVDELVASRLRHAEAQAQSELAALRRDVAHVAGVAQASNPQGVVDAVSMHLTQFKQEFGANQTSVLRRFTENIVTDGARVDERMQQLEGKVAHLEGIIQAEQHASLLALEAISDAFAGGSSGGTNSGGNNGGAASPPAPLPLHHPPAPPMTTKAIPSNGYTSARR